MIRMKYGGAGEYMKKYIITVIWFLNIIFLQNIYSEGRAEIPVENQNEITALAGKILLNAFNSDNYILKREAIYGLRYMDAENIYLNIQTIFGAVPPDYPGFEILKDTALETLHYIAPQRTIQWLVEYNALLERYFSSVLYIFEIQNFFKIIGTENYYHFENINFYLSNAAHQLTKIMILAEQYISTGEEKYLLSVYNNFSYFDPQEYDALFSFFKEKELPNEIIYYNIKERIPYLKTGNSNYFIGTAELKTILFEALLYKYGYTEEVYTKTFYIDNPVTLYKTWNINMIMNFYSGRQDNDITDYMGAEFPELSTSEIEAVDEFFLESGSDTNEENFSIINKPIIYDMDLGKELNSPYYLLCDAAAYCFAGAPKERHFNVFVNNFEEQENSLKYMLAEIITASPAGPIQNRILEFFAQSSNAHIRSIALNAYRELGLSRLPEQFISILSDENETIYNMFLLVRLIGSTGNNKYISVIKPLLEHENSLISVAAAGEILNLIGGF